MPEDAAADRSLRYPAFCNALRKTFSVSTQLLVCRYAGAGVHMLYNSQAPRGRAPLFYDHSNLILRVVVKEGFYCTTFSAYLTSIVHMRGNTIYHCGISHSGVKVSFISDTSLDQHGRFTIGFCPEEAISGQLCPVFHVIQPHLSRTSSSSLPSHCAL